MSDINDLSRPVLTDTEPDVLDTLRAHIVRAATWAGWGNTANKAVGIMSGVTAEVSGGRSLRLYRRNDANTSDEEVISLPGVSVGGNAATASAAKSGSVLEIALAAKAPLLSPVFSGTPTVPTAPAGTNSTQVANTSFVSTAIANLVASSPAALDTLNELAVALGNDPNFATTITNALAGKAPLNGAGATGTWGINITGNALTATSADSAANGVPPGTIAYFAGNTAPTGWLKANGSLVSRTTYAALFAAIGTVHGPGDGSTTFATPDLRGEFARGWDDGRGVDAGRVLGSAQADELKSHAHSYYGGSPPYGFNPGYGGRYSTSAGDSLSTGLTGGTETRPRNVALLACIKF